MSSSIQASSGLGCSLLLLLLLAAASHPVTGRLQHSSALQQDAGPAETPSNSSGASQQDVAADAAVQTAAAAPWACYDWTEWEWQAIGEGQSDVELCKWRGYTHTQGINDNYDGCGGCWCCRPSGTTNGGREYLGCYDYPSTCDGDLTCLDYSDDMTVDKCARTAALAGSPRFSAFAVQGRQCYGIRFPWPASLLAKQPDTYCSTSCPGDSAVMCGRKSVFPFTTTRVSVYSTLNPDAHMGSPPTLQQYGIPYVGCFKEPRGGPPEDRLMALIANEDSMTIERCVFLAEQNNYRYAAVQYYTYCFGSNDVQQYIDQAPWLEQPVCNTKCGGNPYQFCGGEYANSIYTTGAGSSGNNDNCLVVGCPQPPECKTGGECNPADGKCFAFSDAQDGAPCSNGGSCSNGVCVSDPCQGIQCPEPPTCQTGGECLGGQCKPFTPLPNGSPCPGGGACSDGQCKRMTGIQNITFVTGTRGCPTGYTKLSQDLNEGLVSTYARTKIFMCVKKTSDTSKMLHSLRAVDNPGNAGTWCMTLFEKRLTQNLNAGSTGVEQLNNVYICVEYPSANPQIPYLVLDVAFAKGDPRNCPAQYNQNGPADLNSMKFKTPPISLYMCVKVLK